MGVVWSWTIDYPKGAYSMAVEGDLGIARLCRTGRMALTVTDRWSVHPQLPRRHWRVAIGLGSRAPMGDAKYPSRHANYFSPNLFFTCLVFWWKRTKE